ncbi:MAG: DUF2157 domain-containing protein [Saprospiraceae bacterium]
MQINLTDLVEDGIITQETADKIALYYTKEDNSTNRLLAIFGVLGATLIGLGIILIIAHNWDNLSRSFKTIIAFVPLLIGQILCGFAILKQKESVAWIESTASFLVFAIGASIALVSQIYNIPGDLASFLLTWILLCLPLIYVMQSSMVSVLCIAGITYYGTLVGYDYPSQIPFWYWLMLLAILPHYYWLYKNQPKSNFIVFHHWLLPLSLTIMLGTFGLKHGELWMIVAYMSLFGFFYNIGNLPFFQKQKTRSNGYEPIAWLGTMIMLLTLSFRFFWDEMNYGDDLEVMSAEFIAALVLTILGIVTYWYQQKQSTQMTKPMQVVFLLFAIIFLIGIITPVSAILINLLILGIGIMTINNGAKQEHFGILNTGLLIITALVTCRFFDTNLSFVIRGLLFVMVGIGFFGANYWLIQKRKANEND